MKYSEAYSKIIDAYFKDEIRPFDNMFCFCGNLNDNNVSWGVGYDHRQYYTRDQYLKMEDSLFKGMNEIIPHIITNGKWIDLKDSAIGEECLFNGMAKAIEVLKQIHIERGEVIDETPAFTKRELQPA